MHTSAGIFYCWFIFRTEIYSDDINQSSNRYPLYGLWKDKFLGVMIQNAVGRLKLGGYFLLNIADANIQKVVYPLVADTCDLMIENGLMIDRILQMPLKSLVTKNRSESIIVGVKS